MQKRTNKTRNKTHKKYSRPSSWGHRKYREPKTFLMPVSIKLKILTCRGHVCIFSFIFYKSVLLHFAQLYCKILVLSFAIFFSFYAFLSLSYVHICIHIMAYVTFYTYLYVKNSRKVSLSLRSYSCLCQ